MSARASFLGAAAENVAVLCEPAARPEVTAMPEAESSGASFEAAMDQAAGESGVKPNSGPKPAASTQKGQAMRKARKCGLAEAERDQELEGTGDEKGAVRTDSKEEAGDFGKAEATVQIADCKALLGGSAEQSGNWQLAIANGKWPMGAGQLAGTSSTSVTPKVGLERVNDETQTAEGLVQRGDGQSLIGDSQSRVADGKSPRAEEAAQIANGKWPMGANPLAETTSASGTTKSEITQNNAQIADSALQIADSQWQMADGKSPRAEEAEQIGNYKLQIGANPLAGTSGASETAKSQLAPNQAQIELSALESADGRSLIVNRQPQITVSQSPLADSGSRSADSQSQIVDLGLPIDTSQSHSADGQWQIANGQSQIADTQADGTGAAKSDQTMQNTAQTGQKDSAMAQSLPGKADKAAVLTQPVESGQARNLVSGRGLEKAFSQGTELSESVPASSKTAKAAVLTQAVESAGNSISGRGEAQAKAVSQAAQFSESVPASIKAGGAASSAQAVEAGQGPKGEVEVSGKLPSQIGEVSWGVAASADFRTEQATVGRLILSTNASARLERIEAQIQNRAVELRRVGADSMSVVLKPDAKLELHLELRLEQGQVQVLAECKRGDVAALNEHWGQLQQTLSGHGIRLSPLHEASGSGLSDGSGSGNYHGREGESRNQPGNFALEQKSNDGRFRDEAARRSLPMDTKQEEPRNTRRTRNENGTSSVDTLRSNPNGKLSLEWWA